MDIKALEEKIARDLAVELAEDFDRNFERKAFFNEGWPQAKLSNSKGSVMMRSGNLRRSIKYSVRGNQILFSSSLPYASVHNIGGEIVVTAKMKKFFWAMFYKASGKVKVTKDGKVSKSKTTARFSNEAEQWKALALMKVGQVMKIEKRQFVGNHPNVAIHVKNVIDDNMKLFNAEMAKLFRQ